MSEAIAFDTHKFIKNLTESGFTEKQAEALANEQIHLLNSNLATKADIATISADLEIVKANLEVGKTGLETRLQAFKAGLEAKIEDSTADILASQNNMLKWMITAMVALSGLIIAVVKLG